MKSRSKLLKVGEVSEWLNVSRSTIYKWVHEESFPSLSFLDRMTASVAQAVGKKTR